MLNWSRSNFRQANFRTSKMWSEGSNRSLEACLLGASPSQCRDDSFGSTRRRTLSAATHVRVDLGVRETFLQFDLPSVYNKNGGFILFLWFCILRLHRGLWNDLNVSDLHNICMFVCWLSIFWAFYWSAASLKRRSLHMRFSPLAFYEERNGFSSNLYFVIMCFYM